VPNWNEILREIETYRVQHVSMGQQAVDATRRSYLLKLYGHTKRNIIAYYSGWLSKPGIQQSEINDEDKNGFMMAIHRLNRSEGLDLILHTPGGDLAATQSIVDYLRQMFGKDIRAIVPQIAMSAGTMLACSCKVILMSKHSNLGPIDPHLSGVPAAGVIKEFQRACREVKKDSTKIGIWQTIIGQYRPTFLSRCENAIKWSNDFVQEQLATVMFEGDPDAVDKAKRAVRKLRNL